MVQLHTANIDHTLGIRGQWLKAFDKLPIHDTRPPGLLRTFGLRRTFLSNITRTCLLGRCRRLQRRHTQTVSQGVRHAAIFKGVYGTRARTTAQRAYLDSWCFVSILYSHKVFQDLSDSVKILGNAVAGSCTGHHKCAGKQTSHT